MRFLILTTFFCPRPPSPLVPSLLVGGTFDSAKIPGSNFGSEKIRTKKIQKKVEKLIFRCDFKNASGFSFWPLFPWPTPQPTSAQQEHGRRKERGRKEEGRRRKKEEGRRKKEEGRRKKEEGRRKKEEGRRTLTGTLPSRLVIIITIIKVLLTN